MGWKIYKFSTKKNDITKMKNSKDIFMKHNSHPNDNLAPKIIFLEKKIFLFGKSAVPFLDYLCPKKSSVNN